MTFTVDIPDEYAALLAPEGQSPSRKALEDMAVEAYRAGRLTHHQIATILGLTRYELDGFLRDRQVWLEYTEEELRQELALGDELWRKRTGN
jgi:predicted HTH domain antitoxin